MPVEVTSYGGTYGTGLAVAAKKANKAALRSALAAATAANDHVWIPAATTIEVCADARAYPASFGAPGLATLNESFIGFDGSYANPFRIWGGNRDTSIIDFYADFGDGTAAKVCDNRTTFVALVSGTAVGSISQVGATSTLTVPGADFVAAGIVAGRHTLTTTGWPSSGNDVSQRAISFVGTDFIQYTNFLGVTESADGDSTYAMGHVPSSLTSGLLHFYGNMTRDYRSFTFAGLDGFQDDTKKDVSQCFMERTKATAQNVDSISTGYDMRVTGRVAVSYHNGGRMLVHWTDSILASHMQAFNLFDQKTVVAYSQLTVVAGNLIAGGEYFTVDGVVFEFTKGGAASGSNTAVPITDGDSAYTVRNAVREAINASALAVTAIAKGEALLYLYADVPGTAGHASCSENVANAGFTITNIEGGVDASPGSSSGSELRLERMDVDAQGIGGEESTDAQNHGLVGYVHPHVAVYVDECKFRNVWRVGIKQYSQSDGVYDFGGIKPQVVGLDEGIGGFVRDVEFYGLERNSALFDTTDADVTYIVENVSAPDIVDGYFAALNPRCTNFILRDSTIKNLKLLPLGSNEETQGIVNILLQNLVVDSYVTNTTQLIEFNAGWRVTFDNVTHTRKAANSNTFTVGAPVVRSAAKPEDGWWDILGNCRFYDQAPSGQGDFCRFSGSATKTVREGAQFVSDTAGVSWRSVFNAFGTSAGGLNCTGVDFSTVKGAGMYFQSSGGYASAGSITMTRCRFNPDGSNGGVSAQDSTINRQNIELLPTNALDPTVRAASSGTVRVTAAFPAATVTGAVTNVRIGTNASFDVTKAFAGAYLTLIAGAGGVTLSNGGNVTWLSTGARSAGAKMHLVLSADGTAWTEYTPSASLTAPTPTTTEGAAPGVIRVARTGGVGASLDVTVAASGSATAGADYTHVATITIPAGASSVDVHITALLDATLESAETVTYTLQEGGGYTTAGDPATVTIFDASTDAPPQHDPLVFNWNF